MVAKTATTAGASSPMATEVPSIFRGKLVCGVAIPVKQDPPGTCGACGKQAGRLMRTTLFDVCPDCYPGVKAQEAEDRAESAAEARAGVSAL